MNGLLRMAEARTTARTAPALHPASAAGEWRKGWPLALAGAGGLFTAVLYVYSTGLFIEPLGKAFGWTRTDITIGMMIVGLVAVAGNPLVGMVIDRTRPGLVALIGVLAYATALAGLGSTGPDLGSWIIGWILVALASLAISVPVWLVAIARAFTRSRGLALAVGYCGSSVAAMTIPYATAQAIDAFGWSGAYRMLGGLALVVGGLSALTLLRLAPRREDSAAPAEREPGRRGGRAMLRSFRFWRIAAMSMIVTLGVIALTVHYVPIAMDHGLSRARASGLAGIIGVAGIVGRLGTGALLDRFAGTIIGALLFAVPTITCLLVAVFGGGGAALGFLAVAIGLTLGSELDLMAYMTARYFGLAHYGLLFGVLTGLVGCGAGFGPVAASLLRDITGNYDILLLILSGAFAVSAVLVGSLGPYPDNEA
jgi:predicted MFS family arabinose efflux permease